MRRCNGNGYGRVKPTSDTSLLYKDMIIGTRSTLPPLAFTSPRQRRRNCGEEYFSGWSPTSFEPCQATQGRRRGKGLRSAGTPRALHGVAYGAGSDTQHDREMWLVQLPSTPNNPGPGARPAALPSVTSSVEYSPVCAPCRTLGMELGMLPLSALPAIST